jgi:shikimate kinase
MIIFLVGLRGTGKTTVGRLLAERLGLPFHDADAELQATEQRSIRDIVTADGEAAFRDIEERILKTLIGRGPAVIATGGGVVLRPDNRKRMAESGKVVWLTADAATLWQRLRADQATLQQRPDLSGGGISEIEDMLRSRETLYRACAHVVISTQHRSPEQIVADIVGVCSTSSWITAR